MIETKAEKGKWLGTMTTAGLMIALVIGLSACGRRGPLEPPPATLDKTVAEDEAAAKPATTPERPFILDGLI